MTHGQLRALMAAILLPHIDQWSCDDAIEEADGVIYALGMNSPEIPDSSTQFTEVNFNHEVESRLALWERAERLETEIERLKAVNDRYRIELRQIASYGGPLDYLQTIAREALEEKP